MKRLFGTWSLEDSETEKTNPTLGELVIDGNEIEFYRQGGAEMFKSAFICRGGDLCWYKVIAQACRDCGTRKTLEYSSNYRVFYVLQWNSLSTSFHNIDIIAANIASCSFAVPELIDWLGVRLVELSHVNETNLLVKGKIFHPVTLKDVDPRIEIVFDSRTYTMWQKNNDMTTAVVNVQPRIQITYTVPVTIEEINRDIELTMQFWGLMIGRVSIVQDIRLTVNDKNNKSFDCLLYLNHDYSYNLRSASLDNRPRTSLKKIGEDIQDYFSTWYSSCKDEQYDFFRRIYFSTNDHTSKFAEDVFLQYIKILEGYSLRETNDEATAILLKSAIKNCEKEIKQLIFTDDGKPLFLAALQKAIPNWKFNSRHADRIANWIATGYVGRRGLAERLLELDSKYLNLLAKNAASIMKLSKNKDAISASNEEKLKDDFLKKIVSTRNYLSHYKADCSDILDDHQWDATIKYLKALVIAILYSKMGMQIDVIRKILAWDFELISQTIYLQKEGETQDDCLSEKEGKLKENELLTDDIVLFD